MTIQLTSENIGCDKVGGGREFKAEGKGDAIRGSNGVDHEQERVMRLEAQIELIANKTEIIGQHSSGVG